MNNARRERLIKVGSWLLLVFALLPAISYMGHWGMNPGHVEASASSIEDHEAHCHGGVSRCAGGEAMVGSFFVGEESDLLSLTSVDLKIESREVIAAIEGEPSRILQPPQSV